MNSNRRFRLSRASRLTLAAALLSTLAGCNTREIAITFLNASGGDLQQGASTLVHGLLDAAFAIRDDGADTSETETPAESETATTP